VKSAGVVGVTLDGESAIAAYVMLADGFVGDEALSDELRVWCKSRLRRYEYPRVVTYVEELPLTLTGKVQRFRLRELAAASA
jgi:benzoate-CoA ligase